MSDQLRVLTQLFIKATDTQKQNIINALEDDGIDASAFKWIAALSTTQFKNALFAEI